MKRNMLLVLLILALLAPLTCAAALGEGGVEADASNGRLEGPGFDSPEKAALAYIQAYNAGDVSGIRSSFAIETYVDHVDRPASTSRIRMFSVAQQDTMPMPTPYMRDLMVSDRWGTIARKLTWQYVYYAWPEAYLDERDYLKVSFSDSEYTVEEIPDFLGGFYDSEVNDWLWNVSFIGFESPEKIIGDGYLCEENQNIINRMTECSGCDEIAEMILHIQIKEEDYYQFLECARYGDRWYVQNLGGFAALFVGMDPYAAGLVPADALY